VNADSPQVCNGYSSPPLVVNTRAVGAGLTGVQRYVNEICKRLPREVNTITPGRRLGGMAGHLWEQFMLPGLVGSRLLWSPCNSGPLSVTNQVLTVHDVATLDHPEWFNPRFAAWYRWLTPRLLRKVMRVIVGSEFIKSRLIEIFRLDQDRITVVRHGVGAEFHPRPQDEIESVHRTLRIPSARYVLSLCSLEPRKNLARLLAVWAAVIADLPSDVWLVLAGAKGSGSIFRDAGLGTIPPRVHLTGFVPDADLPALYAGALLLAYPSLYEGFGLPPLEAMACGTAVIVGDCPALRELVADAAVLVDPQDSRAIGVALRELIESAESRARFSQLGLMRAGVFTWERCADKTFATLEAAAKERLRPVGSLSAAGADSGGFCC